MGLEGRVSKLERETRRDKSDKDHSGVACVLVTDVDGADFVATQKGKVSFGELVITNGVFEDHKFTGFSGGLAPADAEAIAELEKRFEIVARFEIDGYHLRMIDKAYRARLAREA